MSTSSPNSTKHVIKKGLEETSRPFLLHHDTRTTCWVELDRVQFNHNVQAIKNHIGAATAIAAVLKSNAYGHGLLPVAQLCDMQPHIHTIVVFLLSDALMLRAQGITKPILVLGGYDASIRDAILQHIDLTVFDYDTYEYISACAQACACPVRIHIKVDSGLVRLGFTPQETLVLVELIQKNQHVHLAGIYTHFAESDSPDLSFTRQQIERFEMLRAAIEANGVMVPFVHLANTAAMLRLPQARGTMVRCGGALYGTYKKEDFYRTAQEQTPGFSLASFLRLKTRIIALKQVPPSTPVGYACTYTTTRTTTLAVVALGYFDGYDRRLSNNSVMLVHDKCVPIAGRVAMNMTTLDVTDVPQVRIGDEVTVIGTQTGVRIQELAQRVNTIEYELFVGLNPSLPRIIV